jgi:GT2 family glycosyltransferase
MGRWPRDTVREVDVVTGCLLLIGRELYDRLGGFDPQFFMYGEDVDLSLRARSLGVRPVLTPDAVVVHANGASSPQRADKLRLLMTGKATLVGKHWTGLGRRVAVGLLVGGVGLRAAGARLRRQPDAPWRVVWAERATWRLGFPPGPRPVPPFEIVE